MRGKGSVLLTGASSGIGWHLATTMCERGYAVLGVGRNGEALRRLEDKMRPNFRYIVADLAQRSSLDLIEKRVREEFDVPNVLINNAGFGIGKPVLQHSVSEVEEEVAVNMVRPIQLVLKLYRLIPEGGAVVNVITAGVHVYLKNLPIYGSAKLGLSYASRVLRRELDKRGITLIEVYPGAVKTSFFERVGVGRPSFAVHPARVAEKIIDAIERRKKIVYVPMMLRPLSLFGPLPISW